MAEDADVVRAVIIPVEGDLIRCSEPRAGLLAVAQKTVGGWIEGVVLGAEAILYCNEEGKLQGLPFNPRATALAMSYGSLGHGDVICGPVLVLGAATPSGDEQDAPAVLWDSAVDIGAEPTGSTEN